MNYEQFLANAECALYDCREIKKTISAVQAALSAVPDMVRKNERLEKENAELKGELELMECVQQPSGYMQLPLDADGVPIRIGDDVNVDGDAMTVVGYRDDDGMMRLIAKDKRTELVFAPTPSKIRHFKPEPADSWEKLRADLMLVTSAYCDEVLHRDSSVGIPYEQRAASKADDVIARAKKLAGIEEEAQR